MPGETERLNAALRDRYRIERELGAGGMATVYLAHDLRHERLVALKVLRSDLAAALGAERFHREIRIAATLNHPNIVPLFDSAEVEGALLYVMPYIDGESLRQRLDRVGSLPVAEAVDLASQVARALGYAHSHGVVHRDIKPENILLQAGQAVVSDFGIARAISAAAGASSDATLTEAGIVVGTPRYMSPEQFLGEPVTASSDIYSLGCVLFEMLAGSAPFGEGGTTSLAGRTTTPRPPLRKRRPAVDAHVERVVLRMLALDPKERFQSADDLLLALAGHGRSVATAKRAAATAGVLMVLGAAGMFGYSVYQRRQQPAPLAVLYMENRSRDSSDLYLADGISEEVMVRLAQVDRLEVKSRGVVRRFRGRPLEDPAQVGRLLNVRYLVAGIVERSTAALRIRVELIEAKSGNSRWSGTFTSANGNALAIEDSVSQTVAREVIGRLGSEDVAALTNGPTRNREAYDHYLRGNFYLSHRTSEADGRRALDEYGAALRLDPLFAAAYGRLGLTYGIYASWPWPHPTLSPDSLVRRGLEAANRAIALDSASVDGWLAKGFLLIPVPADADAFHGFSIAPILFSVTLPRCWVGGRDCRASAQGALRRALQLDPRNAEAWYQFARSHYGSQDASDPDSALTRSLALEPDRAVTAWLHAIYLVRKRDLVRAERLIDSAMAMGRRDISAHSIRLEARLARGNLTGAREDLRSIVDLVTRDSLALLYAATMRAAITARAGDSATAATLVDSLVRSHPHGEGAPRTTVLALAAGLISAGKASRGLDLLEQLAHAAPLPLLGSTVWDPVRTQTRFRQLQRVASP